MPQVEYFEVAIGDQYNLFWQIRHAMSEFKSMFSYWDFASAVQHNTRYVRDARSEEFLETVRETGRKWIIDLLDSQVLWRVQIGNDWRDSDSELGESNKIPIPYPPERMKPQSGRAREGRANPKGIPYLYAATERNVALAEVRPWIGSFVSLAQLRLTRKLRIINCTDQLRPGRAPLWTEPSPERRELFVWRDINNAFAKPVSLSDDVADYIPTQIIAGFFRTSGGDGISYRSALGEGNNLVMFDLDSVEIIEPCELVVVKNVKFEFSNHGA
jgi:hypothetical protein